MASIVGGHPGSGVDTAGATTTGYGLRDSDSYGQFYYGLGVAPGVRLGSTKIITLANSGTVAQWTTRAVTQRCNTPSLVCPAPGTGPECPATVQTHSHNEYDATGTYAGYYSTNAQEFDISVRNADRATMKPLAITISAGNYGQKETDTSKMVLAPATAKNAIAVGAAESARTTVPAACATDVAQGTRPDLRNLAQGYDVLAYCSRRGTADSRIKPDLVAPATLAMGARTTASPNTYCWQEGTFASDWYPQYHGVSGTSFAAPVAAGSIALLKYHYTSTYGLSPSPAMYKAMLVAGARSISGSLDRLETELTGTTQTVPKWPNAQQGFGLINMTELLDTTITKSFHDQGTVLLQGQMYDKAITVADPTKPMKIVVAWTDAPAMVGSTIAEVNGLNLTAYWPDYYQLYGNYTDTAGWSRTSPGCGRPVCSSPADLRNNVEVLNINPSRFTDPVNRTFRVRVMASPLNGIGVPGASGGANNQDFALFVINGTIQ